jgi:hypothetical protein
MNWMFGTKEEDNSFSLFLNSVAFIQKIQTNTILTSKRTNKGRDDQHLDGDKLEQMNKYHHV